MNLETLRVFVRTQLDLDDSDLPNALLNVYLQEGYDRAIGLEQRWPFFATMWDIPLDAGATGSPFPVGARVVESLYAANGRFLPHVEMRWAMSAFGTNESTGTSPSCWSTMGDTLFIFPGVSAATTLRALGYRAPLDWIAEGAAADVDADTRLHIPIAWYACSLGYAQQEDDVLEQTYLNRYKESVGMARDAIMRTWAGQPRQVGYTHFPSNGLWGRQPQVVIGPPGEVVQDDTIIGGTP